MKTIIYSWLLIPLLLFNFTSKAQSTAVYDISFTSTWNSTDHGTLPPNPHWSDLVGCNHKNSYTLWKEGAPASLGVKNVAEEGDNNELESEINLARNSGTAQQWLQIGFSPFAAISTATLEDVEISSEFPLLSVISMIAPSPDWFIGLDKVSLLDNQNQWITNLEIDVYTWDAGTDSGLTYSAANQPTNPPQGISSLQGISPFSNEKVGTFTITLKLILNIDEFDNTNLKVYPNPINENLIIESSNSNLSSIDVYNIIGNNVYSIKPISNQTTANFSSLENGMYFVKITNDSGKSITKKIIKN